MTKEKKRVKKYNIVDENHDENAHYLQKISDLPIPAGRNNKENSK